MKIRINTNLLVNVIIIAFIALMVLQVYSISYKTGTTTVSTFGSNKGDAVYTWTADNLQPIDPPVSDSLPYYQHKELKEKVQRLRDLKNGEGFGSASSGWYFGYVAGSGGGMYCDTCTINTPINFEHSTGIKQYYVLLPGWKLNISNWGMYDRDSVMFYVKNGQSYIRKTVYDHIVKNKKGAITGDVHHADVPVKFRYNRLKSCLMIPVTEHTKSIWNYIIGTLGIAMALYFLYLVSAFLKFILDLSKGLSFTAKNIQRLKLISFSLLAYIPIVLLLNLVMRFIFRSYFTDDVIINPEIWEGWWKVIGVGIVFLLLFRAFKQGKELKDEQELTV